MNTELIEPSGLLEVDFWILLPFVLPLGGPGLRRPAHVLVSFWKNLGRRGKSRLGYCLELHLVLEAARKRSLVKLRPPQLSLSENLLMEALRKRIGWKSGGWEGMEMLNWGMGGGGNVELVDGRGGNVELGLLPIDGNVWKEALYIVWIIVGSSYALLLHLNERWEADDNFNLFLAPTLIFWCTQIILYWVQYSNSIYQITSLHWTNQATCMHVSGLSGSIVVIF